MDGIDLGSDLPHEVRAYLTPLPQPSWNVRILEGDTRWGAPPTAVATVTGTPPECWIVCLMVRNRERWTRAHRAALHDELWRLGFRIAHYERYRYIGGEWVPAPYHVAGTQRLHA